MKTSQFYYLSLPEALLRFVPGKPRFSLKIYIGKY